VIMGGFLLTNPFIRRSFPRKGTGFIPDMILNMDLGFSEMLFIFLLALIILGPRRLPELARQFGRIMGDIKRASNDFQAQVQDEVRQLELEETAKKFEKTVSLEDETAIPTILAPEGVVVRDSTPESTKPAENPESHQEQSA
jgi:Tat protein translocase TatB subunit